MVLGPCWPHGLGVQSELGCKETFQKRKELFPQHSLWSLPQSHHNPALPPEILSTRMEVGLRGIKSHG